MPKQRTKPPTNGNYYVRKTKAEVSRIRSETAKKRWSGRADGANIRITREAFDALKLFCKEANLKDRVLFVSKIIFDAIKKADTYTEKP